MLVLATLVSYSLSHLTTAPTHPLHLVCISSLNDNVGGPTAAVIAYQNPHIHVTVVDKNEKRIRRWNSKHLPIYEPGLGDIVRIARDGSKRCHFNNELANQDYEASHPSGLFGPNFLRYDAWTTVQARQPNLFFSTHVAQSIREADLVLIAVNTPTKMKGTGAGSATDMTAFEAVTGEVAQYARPGTIIVEKSTVPCRTAELVQKTVSLCLFPSGVNNTNLAG